MFHYLCKQYIKPQKTKLYERRIKTWSWKAPYLWKTSAVVYFDY